MMRAALTFTVLTVCSALYVSHQPFKTTPGYTQAEGSGYCVSRDPDTGAWEVGNGHTGMGPHSTCYRSGKGDTVEDCGNYALARPGCNGFAYATSWGGYCVLHFPSNDDLDDQCADLLGLADGGWGVRRSNPPRDCTANCEMRGGPSASYQGTIYCYNVDGWSLAPAQTGGSAQAAGDPHLVNVNGQRFDLHKEGWHRLVRVPRGAARGAALLSVEAEARQMGVACADMYFQSVNLTGSWVGSQGRAFNAGRVAEKDSRRWLQYGVVKVKVVQGHTKSGIVYLNLYVRHLKSAGYPVGGILGMDDHTAAAEPSQKCRMSISMLAIDAPVLNPEKASTTAADLE